MFFFFLKEPGPPEIKTFPLLAVLPISPNRTLPICGNYTVESLEDSPDNQSKSFTCSEERCAFYLDNNQCDKINHNHDLYIGWTTAFYGTDKKEVINCKSFAHRKRENAFDWGRAATGFR